MATTRQMLRAEKPTGGIVQSRHGLLAVALRFLWQQQVQQDLAAKEYDVSWQANAVVDEVGPPWHAPNRAQGFRTYFGTRDRVFGAGLMLLITRPFSSVTCRPCAGSWVSPGLGGPMLSVPCCARRGAGLGAPGSSARGAA
jgi:hypothetical protein